MSKIADFEYNVAPLSEGVIRISLAVREDFPAESVRQQLRLLSEDARAQIPEELNQDQQLSQLLTLFYHTWGFGGVGGVYRLSDALWLDNVLEHRQGLPSSLGIILLHIAHALNIPLLPVIFPTQMILRAGWLDGEMWLINPINGDTLDEHTLDIWLRGNIGLGVELSDDDLEEADNNTVVRKLLDTLKSALMDEKQMVLALGASEAMIEFDPDDPYEIRDRGLIYAQLDCDHVALTDLNYFVEQCPEDPISEMIKVQIHTIAQKSVTLH